MRTWLLLLGLQLAGTAAAQDLISAGGAPVSGQAITPAQVQTGFIDAGTEVISGAALGTNGIAVSLATSRGFAWGGQPVGADCTNSASWCSDYDGTSWNLYYGSQKRLYVDQNTATVFSLTGFSSGLYTTTAVGNAFGIQMADQNKIGTSGAYMYPQSNAWNLVANGALAQTWDRTAGITIITPGAGALGRPPGILFESATAVQNSGTCAGNVDLITYTLPASTLVNTSQCILIEVNGTTASNATAKTIDLAVGSTTLVTKALTVSIAGTWATTARLCRTGASTQTAWAIAENYGGTTLSSTDGATVYVNTSFTTPALTETSTQLIRARCITNANAAGDIVAKNMTVTYL